MFALQARSAAPVVTVGPPSALLTFIAGELAPRVAGLWPQSHTPFLTAPAERRHLVCLALALAPEATPAAPERLLDLSLKAAVKEALSSPPAGLARVLGRLGETALPPQGYVDLLRLLQCDVAGKALRHADRIDADFVRGLAALPKAFVHARSGGGFALTAAQARLLAEAYASVERAQGPADAEAAARRWAAAKSAKALFDGLVDCLTPELPAPPFPGSERLRPLATKAAMRDAARRYRNCLRGRISSAADGTSAYYEWAGPPGVVVELVRDAVHGWRLDEARTINNDAVPAAAREAINAELRGMGVYVGRTAWQLRNLAERAHERGFRFETEEQSVAELYGDWG